MRGKRIRYAALAPTAVVGIASFTGTPWAQTPEAQGGTAERVAASSDEIVVTAKKRSENEDVSKQQVAVASQAQLAVASVTWITDLQTVFPTVTATSQAQNSKASGIRDMAPIANSVGMQAQTGIIVDDLPQAASSTLADGRGTRGRVRWPAGDTYQGWAHT
jgi:iron complex outermembrane receptor protein